MGEMIQLQIGQSGNRIGYQYWSQLIKQHNINSNGQKNIASQQCIDKTSICFQQCNKNIYKPRSIFIDSQPNSIQQIMRSPLNNLFGYQKYCYSNVQCRNLWPVGYNIDQQFKQYVLECIRRQMQICDMPSGINLIFSTCGGAGSGIASFIIQNLQQKYQNKVQLHTILIPSPNMNSIVVQPYNSILALTKFNNYSTSLTQNCILFQNQALFKINKKNKQKQMRNYDDINKLIAKGLVNLTSPIRFSCDGNISLRKMCNNLVRYPMQKYFTMSMPFQQTHLYNTLGTAIVYKIMKQNNCSLIYNSNKHMRTKYIANYFIFRGNQWNDFDINYQINKSFFKKVKTGNYYRMKSFKDQFLLREQPHSYIATVVKSDNQYINKNNSITTIQNGSAIKHAFSQLQDKVTTMMRKRAYLHWYTAEGMLIDDIDYAQNSQLDIISTYQTLLEDVCPGGQQGEQFVE